MAIRRGVLSSLSCNAAVILARRSCTDRFPRSGVIDACGAGYDREQDVLQLPEGEYGCGMIEVDKIREAAGCSRLFLRRSSCCLQSLCGDHGTVPTSKVTLGRVVPRDLPLPMSHRRRQLFRPKQQPGRRGEDALETVIILQHHHRATRARSRRCPDRELEPIPKYTFRPFLEFPSDTCHRQLRGEARCPVDKPSSCLRISWPTFISASRSPA
jgi:hypothetical protein